MGQLVDGRWQDQAVEPATRDGRFERDHSRFRNWVTADGRPGPTGRGGFAAEPGRYHLYVSYACPWAHRTLILRALKGLEAVVSLSVTHWLLGPQGWSFDPPETVNGAHHLHQLYVLADPGHSGRVTVPVLWDKAGGTMVSNESADIIRMLNSAFDGVGARPGDYYPADLRAEIDELNARIYDTLNNGVYKAGFATTPGGAFQVPSPTCRGLSIVGLRSKGDTGGCGGGGGEGEGGGGVSKKLATYTFPR